MLAAFVLRFLIILLERFFELTQRPDLDLDLQEMAVRRENTFDGR